MYVAKSNFTGHEDCQFISNEAEEFGGAFYIADSVEYSELASGSYMNNRASLGGGAFFFASSSSFPATSFDCDLCSDNQAAYGDDFATGNILKQLYPACCSSCVNILPTSS